MAAGKAKPGGQQRPRGKRIFHEASAGTGKTEKIQQLVVERVLSEAASVAQLLETTLIVSFSNTAAGELRARTQATIAHAARALDGVEPWRNRDLQATVENAVGDVVDKRRRLTEAQAVIDRLLIGTIHATCNRLISEYPIECEVRPGLTISSDVSELGAEAIADAFAELNRIYQSAGLWESVFAGADPKRGSAKDSVKAPKPGRLKNLAWGVIKSNLPLHPNQKPSLLTAGGTPTTDYGVVRNWFAHEIRERLRQRKERLGVLDLNDLVGVVDRALAPAKSPLAKRICGRWNLIIVDEAQDTDAAQWRILEALAGKGGTLEAVGDPKQSIFGFRGAHYETIPPLVNKSEWTTLQLMTNYRSDKPLLEGLSELFGALPHFEVPECHHPNRLQQGRGKAGAPASGLYLHVAVRPSGSDSPHSIAAAIDGTAEAIVGELQQGLFVQGRDGDRPLGPGDLAVLLFDNVSVERMRTALAARGVPVAAVSDASVLESDELRELAAVLAAIARPSDRNVSTVAAMTRIVGFDNRRLGRMLREGESSADGTALMARFGELRERLLLHGVGAVLQGIIDEPWVGGDASARQRILQEPDGERAMKNLLDVGSLLTENFWRKSTAGTLPGSLSSWLLGASARVASEGLDAGEGGEDRVTLETDGDAVQVMTIHAAKGRQFGSVWVPQACRAISDRRHSDRGQPWRHEQARQLVLEPSPTSIDGVKGYAKRTDREECQRLLYVAATRGIHRTHLVVGCFDEAEKADVPLAHLMRLKPRSASGAEPPRAQEGHKSYFDSVKAKAVALAPPGKPEYFQPGKAAQLQPLLERLRQQAENTGGRIVIEELPASQQTLWSNPAVIPPPPLPSNHLDIPPAMRLTSFSSLASLASFGTSHAMAEEPQLTRVPEDELESRVTDEEGEEEVRWAGAVPDHAANEPLVIDRDVLPPGAASGDLVHDVLERVLPVAELVAPAGLADAVQWAADRQGLPPNAPTHTMLPGPLFQAISQPLGGPFHGLTLAELGRHGTVSTEVPFTMALDVSSPHAKSGNLRAVFEQHDQGDFAGFAEQVAVLESVDIRGLFTGFIDVVWVSNDGKVSVIDHKTNLLRLDGRECLAAYSRPQLIETVRVSRYLLQAALYASVVDARMRATDRSWNYKQRFLGVSFVFLRAMGHPNAAAGDGVVHVAVPESLARGVAQVLGIAGRTSAARAGRSKS